MNENDDAAVIRAAIEDEAARQMLDGLQVGYRSMAVVRGAIQAITAVLPTDQAKCSVPRLKRRI
jgi:hypothetical protein